MKWLKLVSAIPEIIKAVKSLFGLLAFWKKQSNQLKNEQIIKQVEDAKTAEEKQKALDAAASKLGSN